MHPDRDIDLAADVPANSDTLAQDLALDTLCAAMAAGDEFLFSVAKRTLLRSLASTGEIIYRQQALRDCLAHTAVVREIYDIAVQAIIDEKRALGGFFFARSPDAILRRSVEVLGAFAGHLRSLRRIADVQGPSFSSPAFTRFFAMLRDELSDDYFLLIEAHLRRLRFAGGVLVSARLGAGNHGADFVLREPPARRRGLMRGAPARGRGPSYTITIADRDENGARALAELQGRGVNLVANALAQSTDHILSFFVMLRSELAFYIGCANLGERLADKAAPVCWPEPEPVPETEPLPEAKPGRSASPPKFTARGLYDVCLALSVADPVVGNDVDGDGASLTVITGANQGGKSTFLRSVGLAHLMTQAGMFAAASSLRLSVCGGLFTHFKREEDAAMASGKLDEELRRMSAIADLIRPGSVLLCNESFAATNEREGSEIARQIIRALLESGVRIYFVTHLHDLADGFYQQGRKDALFLRAERRPDGRRTFRVVPGEPLPTSFGHDVYRQVFGEPAAS